MREFNDMKKPKIALVRGKFLNKCEMQSFEYLTKKYKITAFGSLREFHNDLKFPVIKLPSPMDIPDFPYKMPLLNRIFIDAHHLFGLEKKLKGYDIAHSAETYYHYTQQCLIAKKKGYVKKVVVTILENIPYANEGIWGRKGFKKRAYIEVDLFLATTQDAKEALIEEGVNKEKIKIIYSGVDTTRFRPSNRSGKIINILFVGRLEKYKGIYNLLKAFIKIQKNHKNIHLSIVGKGSEEEKLKKIVKEKKLENKVSFEIVPYHKIHKVYRNADIFVAPSKDTSTWKEQFGYVLVEAMACGLPVITTNAGSIPEVVKDAAIIIPQNDTKRITDELEMLLKSKRKREQLGKKARVFAVKYYDSKKIAKEIDNIYREIL